MSDLCVCGHVQADHVHLGQAGAGCTRRDCHCYVFAEVRKDFDTPTPEETAAEARVHARVMKVIEAGPPYVMPTASRALMLEAADELDRLRLLLEETQKLHVSETSIRERQAFEAGWYARWTDESMSGEVNPPEWDFSSLQHEGIDAAFVAYLAKSERKDH